MGTSDQLLPEVSFSDYEAISNSCRVLRDAQTKGELGTILAAETMRFSMFDLQVIGGRLRNEIRKLPSPYREAVGPYFIEQIFGMHHRLLMQYWTGEFRKMREVYPDREMFYRYCDMVPRGCFSWDEGSEKYLTLYRPFHRFFYYLISCYTMFILEYPGHPVGMPFPGSFRVEEKDGLFLCPIREKEKDVFYSICNFCPARQMELLQSSV